MHFSYFHFGHLQFPILSTFAVVGLVLSLLLTQRTAPRAGLVAESMWDATVVAILSVYVVSRLLLVMFNFERFKAYPTLFFTLPSVTFTGLLVSCGMMYGYLRWRKLPLIRVLDAATPCLALLWGILSLASFEDVRSGLETSMPWGVEYGGSGRIHPVEIYWAIGAFGLCVLSYLALGREDAPGRTAGTGLFAAGFIAFFVDFYAQPSESSRFTLLDPVQWFGVLGIVVGVVMLLPYVAIGMKEESSDHAI